MRATVTFFPASRSRNRPRDRTSSSGLRSRSSRAPGRVEARPPAQPVRSAAWFAPLSRADSKGRRCVGYARRRRRKRCRSKVASGGTSSGSSARTAERFSSPGGPTSSPARRSSATSASTSSRTRPRCVPPPRPFRLRRQRRDRRRARLRSRRRRGHPNRALPSPLLESARKKLQDGRPRGCLGTSVCGGTPRR